MAAISSHEIDEIRHYVMSQRREGSDDEVSLVQKVGRRRVGGVTHDIYDVSMCGGARYWVITQHTNLYLQTDFQDMDQAFTYHLGLMRVIAEQFKVEPDELQAESVSKPWRRFQRAAEAMAHADEAEDYQAVAIRCREALIALCREHQQAGWIREPNEALKAADVKGWLRVYADSLATGKIRDYVRALSEKTWDLAVWLQHHSNATELEAEMLLGATATLLNTYALLLVRYEQGSPDRCPQCDSYQLREEGNGLVEHDGHLGVWENSVCLSCGWTSEPIFDQWPVDRLRRLVEYHTGAWTPPKRSMEELDPGD